MDELASSSRTVTRKTRIEINSMISNMMWSKTQYPTPYEYQTVCEMLIAKYPKLKDSSGNGIVRYYYIKGGKMVH